MNYIEAAAHNKQFNLTELWKDPMLPTESQQRQLEWVKDPLGRIGFIRATRTSDGAFIVHYPIRVLKTNYMLTVQLWPAASLKDFSKVYSSWSDVYMEFMEILDRVLESTPDHDEARELIAGEVDQLYAQHEGDPLWDLAYLKWIEPADDDDEEVQR